MRSIEYRRWDPLASPLSVEFPAELLLELGWAESSGVLYGSRHAREVRVAALNVRQDEEQEKVGVFASRIRGEVFLTESDLAFMNQEHTDLALVVAGQRAGFFVREANGSIQTVRSHEEFAAAREVSPAAPPPVVHSKRKWFPAGAVALAGLPLVALAMFPQHGTQAHGSIEVREVEHQLRISWTPPQNAVLSIEDGGATVAIPVRLDQSSVVYAPRSGEIGVTLTGLRSISANYKSLAANERK